MKIEKGQKPYLVAELSANHNGKLDRALQTIQAAKEAGADAIKIQTYTADTLTIRSNKPDFRISGGTLWDGKTLHDLYSEAFTPWEWHPSLKEEAESVGLDFFSTPFDATAVDFLESLGVVAHKIASFELTDLALIKKVASTGKPLILSTGMATLTEIQDAVKAAKSMGANQIVLLKCTSAYPAQFSDMNLTCLSEMRRVFQLPVGLSDHSMGIAIPIAATALGACLIEKHFTLSRKDPSPDSSFSLEPHEFRAMADAVKAAFESLGKPSFGPSVTEQKSLVFRRSLYVVKPIRAGEIITQENTRSIRPGYGLSPKYFDKIIGKKALKDIEEGSPLSWDLIDSKPTY